MYKLVLMLIAAVLAVAVAVAKICELDPPNSFLVGVALVGGCVAMWAVLDTPRKGGP